MALAHLAEAFAGQKIDLAEFSAIRERLGNPKIIISLIPGRCGSTWFANMIEQLGACGRGRELFVEKSLENWRKDGARLSAVVEGALRRSTLGGVCWVQISPERFDFMTPLLDIDVLQTIEYSIILRRDILAQAVSYVFAINSGIWHSVQAKADVELSGDRQRLISQLYTRFRRLEGDEAIIKRSAAMYSRQPVLVQYYEDIVPQPREEIMKFLRFYNVPYDLEKLSAIDVGGLKKIPKVGDIELYELALANFPWMERVVRHRQSIAGA